MRWEVKLKLGKRVHFKVARELPFHTLYIFLAKLKVEREGERKVFW